MSDDINTKEINFYSHNEFHNHVVNKDHVVAHLANYMDRSRNPSDDLIHLTQRDDDSSTSASSPSPKQKNRYNLQRNPTTSSATAGSPTTEAARAIFAATPIKTNANTATVTDSEAKNKKDNSLNATSSIITPQPKRNSNAAINITTRQKNDINNLPKTTSVKFYHSPYLKKEFRPDINAFELPPELKSLQPLIMSQHEAFSTLIKDLGNITLILSKIIEKKKESYNSLKNDKKIPRSLRIKCELTTSPYYEEDKDFLNLKGKLKEKVQNFMKEGTEIITEWAYINIQKLLKDRCHDILVKALNILKGLTSFFMEIIGTPDFKSIPSNKYIPLFLLKFYFSNEYIETKEIVDFLEMPVENILIIGTKLLTDATTDEDAELILKSINFDSIDPDNPVHEEFLCETLTCFDEILKNTTVNLWFVQQQEDKQINAAQNLKLQMQSLETINATSATALAIAKATEHEALANSQQLASNLRISNLEKITKKHEQKTNELYKELKTKRTQKNLKGSHLTGSVASPETMTLNKNKTKAKQRVIDLSSDDQDGAPIQNIDLTISPPHLRRTAKKPRRGKHTQSQDKKTVQWKTAESRTYNPAHPVSHHPIPPQTDLTLTPFPPNTSFAASNGTWQLPVRHATQTSNMLPHQQISFGVQQHSQLPTMFQQQHQQTMPTQNPFNTYTHTMSRANPFGTPHHQKRS
jgi:hypothetical protein